MIVFQDGIRQQVSAVSVAACVSVSGSASAIASALSSGANRLTNGESRCVTTSAADQDTEMELIVDDASGNGVDLPNCHQQQSVAGVDRLKLALVSL